MSLRSSTVKMAPSGESSSKIKRKSRRHRPVPSSSDESGQIDVEIPRENTHQSRRVHRDVLNEVYGDAKPSNRRRPNNVTSNGEGGSSRRTPHLYHHQTLSGAPSLTLNRRSDQSVVSNGANLPSRRTLTSSASSIRPSNRKRIDDNQLRATSYVTQRQRSSGNYNHLEYDNNEQQPVGPETFRQEDWLKSTTTNAPARVTLPSRASKYRNLSAGVNKKPRPRAAAVPSTKELVDRPPSRQKHAFPTHLIDANAFDAPEITGRRGSSSSLKSRASSARIRAPTDFSSTPEIDRPPSRYMVKAKRNSKQGITQDVNALSRQSVVEKNIVFSCNQAHHDPKTDGFAEVDESVPPPFRIEVTTDVSECTLVEKSSTPSSGLNTSLSAYRWPFSNQEQLLRVAVSGLNSGRGSNQALSADLDVAQNQLQWFGKDDQINNAHLFETVISVPSPRPQLVPHEDIAIEDDLEDSDGPQSHSREVVNNQQQSQNERQQHVENHFPSRRAAAASKMAAPTTTLSVTDNPELQWIRSSTNPFFVGSSSTVDYDSMDPEVAIEQTPLYSSEDLMTLAAREMTDLSLDDYTAFGDTSIPAPPPSTSGGWGGSRLFPASPESHSPTLRTSLGKDFLSLFAQH